MNKNKFKKEILNANDQELWQTMLQQVMKNKELELTLFELQRDGSPIVKTLITEHNDLITKIEICEEEMKRREIMRELENEKTM